MNRKGHVKAKRTNSGRGPLVVMIATAMLIAALVAIIVISSRQDDYVEPSGGEPAVSVEMANFQNALSALKSSGRVSFYDFYDDQKRLSADANLFNGITPSCAASVKTEDNKEEVFVYELKSDSDAQALLELVTSMLAVGRRAYREGRVVIYGTEALMNEILTRVGI